MYSYSESTADLDLVVTDPSNEEIDFDHSMSASGGELAVNANGGCGMLTNNPVENIFRSYGQAPAGMYGVFIKYYEECNNEGPTVWEVRVQVDGEISSFSGRIAPEERIDVTTFGR